MNRISIFRDKYSKVDNIGYKIKVQDLIGIFLHTWRNISIDCIHPIFSRLTLVERVQIIHSSSLLTNKLHMNKDTITRLMNLGIVEEGEEGIITLTDKYMRYLDEVCGFLSSRCRNAYIDDPYSLMLDSNAYAITSWVGTMKESELVEMLSVVMSIWGEMLLW
jgi:ABC-type protease/lipase transport system fused ATPase/permease subunit